MKRKTPVVKKSLDPNYNHTFVYGGLTLEQLRGMCLELTVWDREAMLSNEFLGGVRLSSGKGEIILMVHLSFTVRFQHFNLCAFSPNCCADEFHSLVNYSVKCEISYFGLWDTWGICTCTICIYYWIHSVFPKKIKCKGFCSFVYARRLVYVCDVIESLFLVVIVVLGHIFFMQKTWKNWKKKQETNCMSLRVNY